jgi:hypothetical protein
MQAVAHTVSAQTETNKRIRKKGTVAINGRRMIMCLCDCCEIKLCTLRPTEKERRTVEVIDCPYYKNSKPTNADRIRAMSDEELAASHLIIPCFYDDDGYGECKYGWHDRKQTCEECKLEWLKQPAEE